MPHVESASGEPGSAQSHEGASPASRLPRIVTEGAWVAVGQVVAVVAGLAGTRVLTALLPVPVYGQFALVTGLGALGSGLLCTPFLQAALRWFPEARDAGKIGVLRALSRHYLRGGVATIALALIAGGAAWTVWGGSPLTIAVFVAAAIFVAVDAWKTYESSFLNAARRQGDYALRTSLDAIARPAAAAACVLGLGASAFHVILGFAAGSALTGVLLRRRIVKGDGAARWSEDPWAATHRSAFLSYAMPLIPMFALNWVMSMGDRYVLAGTWGAEAVGVYAAAYALGSQPFIAANALIFTTLRPVLYDAVARGDARTERRTLRVWLAVVAAVAFGGWLATTVLAKPLCGLLLDRAYGAAADLLPVIAAAYALQMIQQTVEVILYAHGRPKRLVALQLVAATSALTFYFALIPRYGARGAALGTLGSFVVTTTLAFVLSGAVPRIFGRNPSGAV